MRLVFFVCVALLAGCILDPATDADVAAAVSVPVGGACDASRGHAYANRSFAHVRWVSPTGKSSNAGTADKPWPLKYAVDHADADTRIILRDGSYDGCV